MGRVVAALRRLFRRRVPPVACAPVRHAPELYVFFDEAGDLNFNANGSRVFIAGVLCLSNPWPLTQALKDLREALFSGAMIPEKFHASEDRQAVRDSVFALLAERNDLSFYVAVSDKSQVPNEFQDDSRFYALVADFALRAALAHYPSAEPVYVITDQLPVKRKRDAVKKGLKTSLSAVLGPRRYELAHHASAAHAGLQAADYLSWAVYRLHQDGDDRSHALIKHLISAELSVPWITIK